MASSSPNSTAGVARRRRDQAQRSTSRKVAWLVGLVQTQSHHTARVPEQASEPTSVFLEEVKQLRAEVAELRAAQERFHHKDSQGGFRVDGFETAHSATEEVTADAATTQANYNDAALAGREGGWGHPSERISCPMR